MTHYKIVHGHQFVFFVQARSFAEAEKKAKEYIKKQGYNGISSEIQSITLSSRAVA